MNLVEVAEILFIKSVPAIIGFLMEQKFWLIVTVFTAVTLPLVYHYYLSENQFDRIRNNPKNVIATIYLLVLIILLLCFCLGALYTPNPDGKMDEKKTKPSSTEIQSVSERNKQLSEWVDKLINSVTDKDVQNKISSLYEKIVSLTSEKERCSGQLKYCSDQLAAKH